MNVIGIGTSVVTCPKQPSMGCVYKVKRVFGPRRGKSGRTRVVGYPGGGGGGRGSSYPNTRSLQLVSVGGRPRMKLTEDPEKQTLPGSKAAFRFLGSDGDSPLPLPCSFFKSPAPV